MTEIIKLCIQGSAEETTPLIHLIGSLNFSLVDDSMCDGQTSISLKITALNTMSGCVFNLMPLLPCFLT